MKTKTVKLILTCGALLFALLFVNSCSSDDPAAVVDKAALELSITTANGLLATTIEGVGTGNYQRGSRASLAERSEEHTSELQSQSNLVCRLLLEKKKKINKQ